MIRVVAEPRPRYVVETANMISVYGYIESRSRGAWNFAYAYNELSDAESMAARMAEDNEFVRVIDRGVADD